MKRKKLLLFICLIVCYIRPSAQETTYARNTFSFRAGYGNMLKGTAGLTKQSHSYERKLSEGVVWEGQYYSHFMRVMGVGFLYSGFSSKGSHEEGSDHVYTHYIAPQIGLYCFQNQHINIRFDFGAGVMVYHNYSKVFGKERDVKGSSIAANAGVNTTFKLTRHWNLEADIKYIVSSLHEIYPFYHDRRTTVKFNNDPLSISRLNLSAGISYSF